MYDGQRGNYLLPGTHKSFCAQDVAAVTGATVTSINQAAAKMARAGIWSLMVGLANGVLPVRYQRRTGRKGEHESDF